MGRMLTFGDLLRERNSLLHKVLAKLDGALNVLLSVCVTPGEEEQ